MTVDHTPPAGREQHLPNKPATAPPPRISYAEACREAAEGHDTHCDLPGCTTAAALRALAALVEQAIAVVNVTSPGKQIAYEIVYEPADGETVARITGLPWAEGVNALGATKAEAREQLLEAVILVADSYAEDVGVLYSLAAGFSLSTTPPAAEERE